MAGKRWTAFDLVSPDTHIRIMLGAIVWWERWAFNALHGLVGVTGLVYFWMKYLLVTDDPFALVNHPWQGATLTTHLVAAPLFIVVFGMLFRSHALRKILAPSRHARRSGWTSVIGFVAMALSGYFIQVAPTPALVTVGIWTHVATSLVFVVGYTAHLIIGWRPVEAEPVVPRIRRPKSAPIS